MSGVPYIIMRGLPNMSLMGGAIRVENRAGRGFVIVILLFFTGIMVCSRLIASILLL